MKMKKWISALLAAAVVAGAGALPVYASQYANYDPAAAANYAVTYGKKPNKTYKKLNQDCTGFVSQAVAVGGVFSYISDYKQAPSVLKDWIMEDNPNAWYMIKKKRSVGLDYWVYSKTWGMVNDFRSFHSARAAKGKIRSGKLNATTPSKSGFELQLRKNAKVGEVWQLDGTHSIIITKVSKKADGYNYVWYSAHTENRADEDIQVFLRYCNKEENKGKTIYAMYFG